MYTGSRSFLIKEDTLRKLLLIASFFNYFYEIKIFMIDLNYFVNKWSRFYIFQIATWERLSPSPPHLEWDVPIQDCIADVIDRSTNDWRNVNIYSDFYRVPDLFCYSISYRTLDCVKKKHTIIMLSLFYFHRKQHSLWFYCWFAMDRLICPKWELNHI